MQLVFKVRLVPSDLNRFVIALCRALLLALLDPGGPLTHAVV
jgi:hypothetical protein